MWVLTTTIHDNDGEVVFGSVMEFDEQPNFETIDGMVENTPLADDLPAMVVSLTFGGVVINIWERVLDVRQKD